ncbi:cytochrome P450 [Nocardia cyriacigeorgica]|uniref:cytochrome P450 n=1 Tax=Nocardia cyriacigeorgica TaxID=135487 RepID=UPI00189475FD|nr:cytochrome P450 [Nocardia cyriacigeorgica]MBF6322124.1 cytochrome P450 [Nocardia cyriacigeorgica]MBF6497851.1 cytochrome P450 [Nocardia cyriacigeorgica]
MKPQYLFRWLSVHGAPRAILRTQARRGDAFAQLMGGPIGLDDPYPLIEQLRGAGGLQRASLSWVTFDHGLSRSILRDNRFGVRAPESFVPGPLQRLAKHFPIPPNPVEPPSMLVIDPPEHTRMRKPVSSAFTPRAIGKLRDRVESVTTELLDALPAHGSADLVRAYAAQVPIAIISEMLGFPDADREMFLNWGDRMTPLLDLGISWRAHQRAMDATHFMNHYLVEHIERLRRNPGDDILSSLVTAGELNTEELIATASLLMGAGFETTVNLIGNGVGQLLAHPGQLARLRDEPELWPNAVEEVLRFDPPVQTTARTALADLEFEGVPLRAGATIVLSLAGANRDPAVFEEPARFDITRANAKDHLTFSSGIHVCLGASLARMEATYALRALFERFPELRLEGPPRRRQLFTLHGYEQMPVNLGPRARSPQHTGV